MQWNQCKKVFVRTSNTPKWRPSFFVLTESHTSQFNETTKERNKKKTSSIIWISGRGLIAHLAKRELDRCTQGERKRGNGKKMQSRWQSEGVKTVLRSPSPTSDNRQGFFEISRFYSVAGGNFQRDELLHFLATAGGGKRNFMS